MMGGKWENIIIHQYDDINQEDWNKRVGSMYGGIGQCNLVLDDLSQLNPSKFNLSDSELIVLKRNYVV